MIRLRVLSFGALLSALLLGGATSALRAETPEAGATAPEAPTGDPVEGEMVRARILGRLGRVEEALAAYRALLRRRPDDRALREEYAELLVDAGLMDEAGAALDRYLADDPTSERLRRLRARVDLARGSPAEAGRRLGALAREQPPDSSLTADLAAAELAAGRWSHALDLYGGLLDADPENRDLQTTYREIAYAHAPRFELGHYSLLQSSASQHVEEAVWVGWLAERWWLRAGARYGTYHQDHAEGQNAFTEEVGTALAAVGLQATRALSLWTGLEESRRRETIFRTTGRLGAAYDDGRATTAILDIAIRELLTNPVSAVPRNGATDRVTLDVARRILTPVVLGLHYDFRHYRVSGEDLGHRWEAAARAEIELLRTRVQVTLIPQVFFSEYTPTAGSPLRDEVVFLRREDIVALGGLVGWDVTSALRIQVGAVGRRDFHRATSSWEATAEGRWRIRPWLDARLLYTRNTESTTVGGEEQSFLGRLEIRY
ncbi:MAG TPA: tetratricopeptide repeat protein [Methylomirabilota bacterium]|jgi:tetratricopeptide (TPR) repeat protein